MGDTLQGNQVLLFGDQKDINAWPVVMLGIDPNGQPQPVAVSTGGASSVTQSPSVGTLTDRSGTITAGGTAQTVAAALATRKYFFFQNLSDTAMYINFGVVAVGDQPSILIAAGASYENPPHFCPVGLISLMCATTGKKFVCKEG